MNSGARAKGVELTKVQTVRVHELPVVFRRRSYLIDYCIARLRAWGEWKIGLTAERCLQRPLLEGNILASMLAHDVAMTLCRLELSSKKRLDKVGILKTITKAEAER
jgi:hypothetical protein